MSYIPPNGGSVGLNVTLTTYTAPPAGSVNLEFDPASVFTLRQAGGISCPVFEQSGFIINNQRVNVYLTGIPPPSIPVNNVIEKVSQKIYPSGIAPLDMSNQRLIYQQLLTSVGSIAAPENSQPIIRIRLKGGYNPPPASSVILEFRTEPYSSPPASSVILEFGTEGYSHILGATLGEQSSFGVIEFISQSAIYNISLGDTSAFGANILQNFGKSIYAQGIVAPTFPTSNSFEKVVKVVNPSGITPPTFSNDHKFDNRLKKVNPSGITYPTFPVISSFTNFTQPISPTGIAPPSFPVKHTVSYGSTDWDTFNYSLMLF